MNDDTTDPRRQRFERRSEALGRAIKDLLAGAPDATEAEQTAHVRRVTDRLTEDWDAPTTPPRTETCCGCGKTTTKPELVRVIEVGSGPGGMLYACPTCAPHLRASHRGMTATPVPLSPECDLARDHEPLHRLCSDGKDIPLPDARPWEPLLAKAWCGCGCHKAS